MLQMQLAFKVEKKEKADKKRSKIDAFSGNP